MPWGGLGAWTKYYKGKIAASWRAEVRRQQADGSLEADLEEGVHVRFQVTINPYGNTRRQLGFVGRRGYQLRRDSNRFPDPLSGPFLGPLAKGLGRTGL